MKNIPYKDKLLFTKHLSVMIKAGIPISEALKSLAEQTKKSKIRKIIENIGDDVGSGKSLKESMEKNGDFDGLYLGLVEVGEESGNLDGSLEYLVNQMGKQYSLNSKIRGAMLYPGLVMAVTLVMGAFMSLYILPQLVDFFDAFDSQLPLTTKILLGVASFMKNYGQIFFGALFGLIGLIWWSNSLEKLRIFWQKIFLKIPIVGNMGLEGDLARFGQNLGILLKSGIAIDEAILICARTLSFLPLRQILMKVRDDLAKGKEVSEAIRKNGGKYFPELVSSMVAVGEKSGNIDETLQYIGNFYEDEVDATAKNLSTLLEPILLIVIGLIVAFVALAIISPIYGLIGSIR